MTTKQLITELKKMPPNAEVYIGDHDHSEWEYNGLVGGVNLVDFENLHNDSDGYWKNKAKQEGFYSSRPIVKICVK